MKHFLEVTRGPLRLIEKAEVKDLGLFDGAKVLPRTETVAGELEQ